eukprot:7175240-Prymnesium_polylepis.1
MSALEHFANALQRLCVGRRHAAHSDGEEDGGRVVVAAADGRAPLHDGHAAQGGARAHRGSACGTRGARAGSDCAWSSRGDWARAVCVHGDRARGLCNSIRCVTPRMVRVRLIHGSAIRGSAHSVSPA